MTTNRVGNAGLSELGEAFDQGVSKNQDRTETVFAIMPQKAPAPVKVKLPPISASKNMPERALKQIETRCAADIIAEGGLLPSQPVYLTDDKLNYIELKFTFQNVNRLPAGIPRRVRDTDLKAGEISAMEQLKQGNHELALLGRHRKNKFDTGERVVNNLLNAQVANLRKGMANIGLRLLHCYRYIQPGQFKGQFAKHVVVLRFGKVSATAESYQIARANLNSALSALATARKTAQSDQSDATSAALQLKLEEVEKAEKTLTAIGEELNSKKDHYEPGTDELKRETIAALRELSSMTWEYAHVWSNPNKVVTVNMVNPKPDIQPSFAIKVRDYQIAVDKVDRRIEED